MSDDIAFRLRHIYSMGQMNVVNEAADEIERLTEHNQKLITKCIHLETELARLERASNG